MVVVFTGQSTEFVSAFERGQTHPTPWSLVILCVDFCFGGVCLYWQSLYFLLLHASVLHFPDSFSQFPQRLQRNTIFKKNSYKKKLKTIKTLFCMMEYNIGKAFFIDVTMKALFLFHYTLKD